MTEKRYIDKKYIDASTKDEFSKEYKFSKMFEWLENDPSLSPGAKLIYARLRSYGNDDKKGWIAFPKQSTLAAAVGMPVRTCQSHIAELVKCGLVESNQRGHGRSNYYRFLMHETLHEIKGGSMPDAPPPETSTEARPDTEFDESEQPF